MFFSCASRVIFIMIICWQGCRALISVDKAKTYQLLLLISAIIMIDGA